MDNDLKQYLDQKFAGIDQKFAGIDQKFAAIDQKFAAIDQKFATKEDLERVETALLTEFHKWASPAEMRAKSHTLAIRAMDVELETLTERVQKLERDKAS